MIEGRPVVLVTGASGFIGRHLTPTLESNGWIVRQVLRTQPARPGDVFVPSIGSSTDWRDAVVGVDAVVHLAARVHHAEQSQSADSYEDTNVEGTLNLARYASNAGVGQFVFISTVLVHGRSSDGLRPYSESDELDPRNVYARSKAAAEAGLAAMARDGEMRMTVIRPPMVYGAGAKGNFKLLMRAVERGIPLPLAAIRNRRAFVSVQNLASFILARLVRAERNFDVFLVADHEQVSTPDFIRRLAMAAGMRARLFPIPAPLLHTLLRYSGRPETRESLLGSLELDLSKAMSTGWSPPVSLDEGLRLATNGFAADRN
jgi:UDP-glucose 4-epimerase